MQQAIGQSARNALRSDVLQKFTRVYYLITAVFRNIRVFSSVGFVKIFTLFLLLFVLVLFS